MVPFVISLLALVQFAGARTSDVSDCQPHALLNCTSKLEELNNMSALNFGSSTSDLDKVCKPLKEGLQCIEEYAQRNLAPDVQAKFTQIYGGSVGVIKELCEPGSFQDEYLKHAQCMDSAKMQYKVCLDEYNSVVRSINTCSPAERVKNLKLMCCSFKEYIKCSQDLVFSRCNNDTAAFTEKFLVRLSNPVSTEHCAPYTANQADCEDLLLARKTNVPVVADASAGSQVGEESSEEDDGDAAALTSFSIVVLCFSLGLVWS